MLILPHILFACQPEATIPIVTPPPTPAPITVIATPPPEPVIAHAPPLRPVATEVIAAGNALSLTGRSEILLQSDGQLSLFGPLLGTHDLGLFPGTLGPAARLHDETLLVERDGTLFTWDGDWRSTPLDAAIVDLERWLDLPNALWLEDSSGLRRLDDTFTSFTLDGEPIRSPWAVGGTIFGTQALWATRPGRVIGITERSTGWLPLVIYDVEAKDLAVDRDGWVIVLSTDGLLHVRNPTTATWSRNSLPHTVHRLYAHPRGEGLWLRTSSDWYVFLDGTFYNVGPISSGKVSIDSLGRLLRIQEGTFERLSITRPIQVIGLEPADILATPRTLSIAPTAPDDVVSVSATAFGLPLEVSERPWQVLLDPLDEPDGSKTFAVDVTYADDSHGQHSVQFWVGAPEAITWEADVLPLHQTYCSRCHDGDVETLLDTREAWMSLIPSILAQVQTGAMPLGGPPLSDIDIATIRSWRNDGFSQ